MIQINLSVITVNQWGISKVGDCVITGCDKKRFGQGMCSKHYSRLHRHGDPMNAGNPKRMNEKEFYQKSLDTRRRRSIENPGYSSQARSTAQKLRWSKATQSEKDAKLSSLRSSPLRIKRLREARSSEPSRLATSMASKRTWSTQDDATKTRRITAMLRSNPSSLERTVAEWMTQKSVAFISQFRVASYFADFFIPASNLIVECDGRYWHSIRVEHDAKRDVKVAALGFRIIRLSQDEIENGTFKPKLEAAIWPTN